ncbi:MAG: DUF350 domain-containing protein [Calditrichaeota bacterium]|nr:DUF350 domain-containing protein [Calditrichota bacterium]
MTLDQVVTGIIYLVSVFILFVLGKLFYDRTHPAFRVKEELVEKDNMALAVDLMGYYLGLVLALGGILEGPSVGLVDDLLDIFFFGTISILLLNVSVFINNKIILPRFDNYKEIIQDQNVGTGVVQAGNHIAIGLIIYGAISGQGGDLITATVFWILGQLGLIVAAKVYNFITPFDIHEAIERDNVAVGVAFAGVLVALGNIVRLGTMGDFYSWQFNLTEYGKYYLFGIVMLPLVRMATDKLLLPGARLTDEVVHQEHPNVGAGILEAFSYIAASFLLGWIV